MANKRKNKKSPSPEEMKKKIGKYFDIYLKRGYSISGLRHFLEEEGYPPNIIGQVADEHRTKAQIKKKAWFIGLIVAALIIIIIPFFLVFAPEELEIPEEIAVIDCGFNKQCLIDLANDCEKVVLHQDEDGSIIRYEISDCSLDISFEKFAADEPEEMRELLGDKTMECSYGRGNFDASWLDSFIAGVEFCEGDLKNALFTLKIAQLVAEI